jgi:hypothetical protein
MDKKAITPEADSGVDSQAGERSGGVTFHGGQVTVGGDIVGRDKIVHGRAPTELTAAERVEIVRLLAELKSQLASLDIPESKKLVGQEFAGQLEQELTRTDKPPDASTIKVAGNWLLDNVPTLAGTVASVFASPIVGKVVEAAGDVAAEWVKKRFGGEA